MTELIWDGKYVDGKKVAPPRVALPFQAVETVNESAQQRQRTLDLFSAGRDAEWRNRLIWGDKRYVLPSLLPEFAGKVNLIYIDPPFNVGADFSFTATIPDNPDTDEDETTSFVKEPSVIETKAYRDTWGRGLDSYLQWFYETVVLLRELLAEDGSIYVHLDWHVGHYAKAVLDEVFGIQNFRNEIIWQRTTNTGSSKGMANKFSTDTDSILYYSKSDNQTFNRGYLPYSEDYLARFKYEDARGKYRWQYMATYSAEKLSELKAQGRIRWAETATHPEYKQYLSELKGIPLNNLWKDIFHINPMAIENVGYATQKPEELLDRIISVSSNEAELVLDCFGGSGTTAVVAEKLNRRWITADLGRFAIHTTRKRLLSIENVRPFVVQNLGKYERQVWQAAEFSNQSAVGSRQSREARQQQAYRNFILELYKARAITGYSWLHGVKSGRMVHVGAVDSPVSVGDVKNIVTEFKRAIGTGKDAPATNGVDVLGWDFAFELNEVAIQQAAQANVNVRFLRIPREVLEKKAVEQGDIRFFELAALKVKVEIPRSARNDKGGGARNDRSLTQEDRSVTQKDKGREVTLTLEDFVIPPDDVPDDVQRAIKHWSQWIDYWAVDWDNKGDTFHNEWQTYRTRKSPELQKSIAHTYEAAGEYTIVVKVIDILGNDTTKTVRVKVS